LNLVGKKKQEDRKNCIQRKFRSLFLIKCYLEDQIKVNAMGGYVILIAEKRNAYTVFFGGSLKA
jgi:hypothetical protein